MILWCLNSCFFKAQHRQGLQTMQLFATLLLRLQRATSSTCKDRAKSAKSRAGRATIDDGLFESDDLEGSDTCSTAPQKGVIREAQKLR